MKSLREQVAMTDQEKRVRIAEAVGWRNVRHTTIIQGRLMRTGVFGKLGDDERDEIIPEYLEDLNAIAEAERAVLTTDELRRKFTGNLLRDSAIRHPGKAILTELYALATATARQRAEALLRVLEAKP